MRELVDRHNDVMSPLGVELEERWPGSSVQDDALDNWIDQEAWGHHACCTAAIGPDDTDVLNSRFEVNGVHSLRVVDASVFPRIPGTFIALPIYMISEKAADSILADAE